MDELNGKSWLDILLVYICVINYLRNERQNQILKLTWRYIQGLDLLIRIYWVSPIENSVANAFMMRKWMLYLSCKNHHDEQD